MFLNQRDCGYIYLYFMFSNFKIVELPYYLYSIVALFINFSLSSCTYTTWQQTCRYDHVTHIYYVKKSLIKRKTITICFNSLITFFRIF